MQFPFLTSQRIRPKAGHLITGEEGESIACAYLRSIGYTIRHRNVRVGHDELDAIAHDPEDDVLVFVEVKTRRNDFFGYPEDSVGKSKQQLLTKAAAAFLEKFRLQNELRFDIVSITLSGKSPQIYHIEDAFFLAE